MNRLAFNGLPVIEEGVGARAASVLSEGEGVFWFGAPAWVRRDFCKPGRNIRLHPSDWFPYGTKYGGVDEVWWGCTIKADNPNGPWHEGLAMVVTPDGSEAFQLAHAIAELKGQYVGESTWNEFGEQPFYTKFFDNKNALPHHLHQRSRPGGPKAKPEAYYFPPHRNNGHCFAPDTFMGLRPKVTRDQLLACLAGWDKGYNGILELSYAFRMQVGTGFLMPAGVLHAPAGRATFEPQRNSDTFNMYQNITEDGPLGPELLYRDVPAEADPKFMLELVDWALNTDPNFYDNHFCPPIPIFDEGGVCDRWVVYGTVAGAQEFSVKELTLKPGTEHTIDDGAVSIVVAMNGHGRFGKFPVEAPGLLRISDLTHDAFGVAARSKVKVVNNGLADLVLLRTFGPNAFSDMP